MRPMFVALVCGALGWSHSAAAQDYPRHPIFITVGYAAGGFADVMTRLLAEDLRKKLGQPIIVNNRPGAGGTVAASALAKTKPDGYNLFMATNAEIATLPALQNDLPYDMNRDFIPITLVGETPLVIMANAKSKFKSISDLLSAGGNAATQEILYSTPGVGSTHHILAEAISLAKKIKMVHVPYRGGAPASAAVATGEVPIGIAGVTSAMPLIESGHVTALAITAKQRLEVMPKVATLVESGVDLNTSLWVGLFAPAGTPSSIVEKLRDAVNGTLKIPKIKELMAAQGVIAVGTTGEELSRRRQEEAAWAKSVATNASISLK